MKIKILYEDKDLLVIEKPSGIMVHPDGRNKDSLTLLKTKETITDWVIKNYPKIKKVGEPLILGQEKIDRPGIVHRLDKDTSGVLIIAKTQKAFSYLKQQFMDRKIKKTYNAIVSGWLHNADCRDYGLIDKAIGRSPSDFRKRLCGRGARGELKEAVTEYKIIKKFEDKNKNKFTFLEIKPKTGRTHQIRVHMKFLNHPVICDNLYNEKSFCPKELNRLALHAQSIEFKNLKEEKIKVESALPKEFKKFINLTLG